jgi:ABC-type phosphate/phosphonate transport system ATPase subunit
MAKRLQKILLGITESEATTILPNHYRGFAGASHQSYKMIFQQFNLFRRLNGIENVLAGRLAALPTLRVLTRRFGRADRQMALWCLDTVGLATDYADRIIALRDGRILEDAPTRNFDARALEQIYERSVAPAGGVAGG